MDIIEVGGKVYGVVITQDDAGAEIGLWCGDEQVAAILIAESNKLVSFVQPVEGNENEKCASRKKQ